MLTFARKGHVSRTIAAHAAAAAMYVEANWRRAGPASRVAASVMFGAVALAASDALAAGAPSHPSLFGTREVGSANLALVPKWTGVIERTVRELGLADGSCKATLFGRCPLGKWGRFLDRLRGANAMTQLTRVNRYMNRVSYTVDRGNYGVADHWATPRQFLGHDGDCEDYAIAKFMSLRALGWDAGHMRIVLLKDLKLNMPHAVLVAYSGGKAWMLDNQIRRVIVTEQVRHYLPYFSVNEDGWWRHRREAVANSR